MPQKKPWEMTEEERAGALEASKPQEAAPSRLVPIKPPWEMTPEERNEALESPDQAVPPWEMTEEERSGFLEARAAASGGRIIEGYPSRPPAGVTEEGVGLPASMYGSGGAGEADTRPPQNTLDRLIWDLQQGNPFNQMGRKNYRRLLTEPSIPARKVSGPILEYFKNRPDQALFPSGGQIVNRGGMTGQPIQPPASGLTTRNMAQGIHGLAGTVEDFSTLPAVASMAAIGALLSPSMIAAKLVGLDAGFFTYLLGVGFTADMAYKATTRWQEADKLAKQGMQDEANSERVAAAADALFTIGLGTHVVKKLRGAYKSERRFVRSMHEGLNTLELDGSSLANIKELVKQAKLPAADHDLLMKKIREREWMLTKPKGPLFANARVPPGGGGPAGGGPTPTPDPNAPPGAAAAAAPPSQTIRSQVNAPGQPPLGPPPAPGAAPPGAPGAPPPQKMTVGTLIDVYGRMEEGLKGTPQWESMDFRAESIEQLTGIPADRLMKSGFLRVRPDTVNPGKSYYRLSDAALRIGDLIKKKSSEPGTPPAEGKVSDLAAEGTPPSEGIPAASGDEGPGAGGVTHIPIQPEQAAALRGLGWSERTIASMTKFQADEIIKAGTRSPVAPTEPPPEAPGAAPPSVPGTPPQPPGPPAGRQTLKSSLMRGEKVVTPKGNGVTISESRNEDGTFTYGVRIKNKILQFHEKNLKLPPKRSGENFRPRPERSLMDAVRFEGGINPAEVERLGLMGEWNAIDQKVRRRIANRNSKTPIDELPRLLKAHGYQVGDTHNDLLWLLRDEKTARAGIEERSKKSQYTAEELEQVINQLQAEIDLKDRELSDLKGGGDIPYGYGDEPPRGPESGFGRVFDFPKEEEGRAVLLRSEMSRLSARMRELNNLDPKHPRIQDLVDQYWELAKKWEAVRSGKTVAQVEAEYRMDQGEAPEPSGKVVKFPKGRFGGQEGFARAGEPDNQKALFETAKEFELKAKEAKPAVGPAAARPAGQQEGLPIKPSAGPLFEHPLPEKPPKTPEELRAEDLKWKRKGEEYKAREPERKASNRYWQAHKKYQDFVTKLEKRYGSFHANPLRAHEDMVKDSRFRYEESWELNRLKKQEESELRVYETSKRRVAEDLQEIAAKYESQGVLPVKSSIEKIHEEVWKRFKNDHPELPEEMLRGIFDRSVGSFKQTPEELSRKKSDETRAQMAVDRENKRREAEAPLLKKTGALEEVGSEYGQQYVDRGKRMQADYDLSVADRELTATQLVEKYRKLVLDQYPEEAATLAMKQERGWYGATDQEASYWIELAKERGLAEVHPSEREIPTEGMFKGVLPEGEQIRQMVKRPGGASGVEISIIKAVSSGTPDITTLMRTIGHLNKVEPGWEIKYKAAIEKLVDSGELVRTWDTEGGERIRRRGVPGNPRFTLPEPPAKVEAAAPVEAKPEMSGARQELERKRKAEEPIGVENPRPVSEAANQNAQIEVDRRASNAAAYVDHILDGPSSWSEKREALGLENMGLNARGKYPNIPVSPRERQRVIDKMMRETESDTGLFATGDSRNAPKTPPKKTWSLPFGDEKGFARFYEDEIERANLSARWRGAVGEKAITPRYVIPTTGKGEKVLDYGAGPPAIHTDMMRQAGIDATAHEFGRNFVEGVHDPKALSRKYDTVMASNVLNVQASEDMIRRTLTEIRDSVTGKGRVVFNYPQSPRYADIPTARLEAIIREFFPNVRQVGGEKGAPIWESKVEASGQKGLFGSERGFVRAMESPLLDKQEGRKSVLDVARAMQAYGRRVYGQPVTSEKGQLEKAVSRAREEIAYQLKQENSGAEWYRGDIDYMERVQRASDPRLFKEDGSMEVFKAVTAVQSYLKDPIDNLRDAQDAWRLYHRNQKMPMTRANGAAWGLNQSGHSGGMRSIQRVLDHFQDEVLVGTQFRSAADWLMTKHPVSELREMKRGDVPGKATDMKYGAEILGDKGGPFFLNLVGIKTELTADRWWSRTWNRWMGNMLGRDKEGLLTVVDQPRNQGERIVQRKAASQLAEEFGLDVRDIQAVMWYYEQELYRRHGVPLETWSYADAARKLAPRQLGLRTESILARIDAETGRGTAKAGKDAGSGQLPGGSPKGEGKVLPQGRQVDEAGFARFRDEPWKDDPTYKRILERLDEYRKNPNKPPPFIEPQPGESDIPGALKTAVAQIRSADLALGRRPETAPIVTAIKGASRSKKKWMQGYYDKVSDITKGLKRNSEDALAVFDILDGRATRQSLERDTEFAGNAERADQIASKLRAAVFEPIINEIRTPDLEKLIGEVGYIRSYAPHMIARLKEAGFKNAEAMLYDLLPAQYRTGHVKKRDWKMEDYERDIFTVLPAYISGTGKTIHDIPAFARALEVLKDVPDGPWKQLAQWYSDNYIGNPRLKEGRVNHEFLKGLSEKISRVYYDAYIGGNPASALLNLTQTLFNTYPELGRKHTVAGIKALFDPAKRKQFDESGLLFDFPDLEELTTKGKFRKGLHFFFRKAEYTNRGIAYLGGLDKAKTLGLVGDAAESYAWNVVEKTQFSYGKESAIWLLEQTPAALRTFQTFALKENEFVTNLFADAIKGGREERAKLGRFLIMAVGIPTAAAVAGVDAKTIDRYTLGLTTMIPGGSPFAKDFLALGKYLWEIESGKRDVSDIPVDALVKAARLLPGSKAAENLMKDTGIIEQKKRKAK